ncbi:MAG: hypothetical protein E7280_11565 [Lachnospiraceae bacterium]|nr:hypothetical protein [Lachnospiraceae bacterium]
MKNTVVKKIGRLFLLCTFIALLMLPAQAEAAKQKAPVITVTTEGVDASVAWKPVKGAKGYELYRCADSKFKKVCDITDTKYLDYNWSLSYSGKLKYKLRSYKVSGGKKVFSDYSKPVTWKPKKVTTKNAIKDFIRTALQHFDRKKISLLVNSKIDFDDVEEAYSDVLVMDYQKIGESGDMNKKSSGNVYVMSFNHLPKSLKDAILIHSEKEFYIEGLKLMENMDKNTILYSVNGTDYGKLEDLLYWQHFEYRKRCRIWHYDTFRYFLYTDGMKEAEDGRYSKASEAADALIAQLVRPEMSDREKIEVLHDYIITHTVYDVESYENDAPADHPCYDAYGCLVNHKCVCSGYAAAMTLLADKLGIPCIYISSDEMDHAFNYIKLDGRYTYMDMTWDDPVPDGGDTIVHTYFDISEDKIDDDHQWNREDYSSIYIDYTEEALAAIYAQ